MSNIESLFCKEELGDDWYAGGKTPPTWCLHCGKKSMLGKVLNIDELLGRPRRE